MTVLTVYVPNEASFLAKQIKPGSGIVGSPSGYAHPEMSERIDYEGNLYGAMNMNTYTERVYHAAGRHVTKYPTVARVWCNPADLVRVGTFHYETQVLLIDPDMQPTVDAWIEQWKPGPR